MYGWKRIPDKQSYGDSHGAWIETSPEEMEKLIALLLYFGLVDVASWFVGKKHYVTEQIQSNNGNAACGRSIYRG